MDPKALTAMMMVLQREVAGLSTSVNLQREALVGIEARMKAIELRLAKNTGIIGVLSAIGGAMAVFLFQAAMRG